AGITGYFLLTFNWRIESTQKFTVLRPLGIWIQDHLPFMLPGDFHPNAAGGALAITLPFAFAAVIWAFMHGRRMVAAIALLATLSALLGMLLTVSRGGWLGLATGAGAAAYAYWHGRRDPNGPTRWRVDGLLLFGCVAIAGGL